MTTAQGRGGMGVVFYILCALAAAGYLVAPYLVFAVAPEDPNMGFSQKIFYFHVPCAWSMFLATRTCREFPVPPGRPFGLSFCPFR